MEYNFQKLSKKHNGGFPAKKTSERKKHYGPFMCELNSKGNRCVQSGERMDTVNCRLNENNNCALAVGHEVHHLEHPRKERSASPKKKRASSGTRKSNPWLVHVAAYRVQHPDLSYQEVLSEAAKTYTKKK